MKTLIFAATVIFSLNLLASDLKMAGEKTFISYNGDNIEITLESGEASKDLYAKGVEKNGIIDSAEFDDGSGYKITVYKGFVCQLKYAQNKVFAGRTESVDCTISTNGKNINYSFTDRALLEREGLL